MKPGWNSVVRPLFPPATLFVVGRRTREMVRRVLGDAFDSWLMSDGYWVCRDMDQRLRCLAHLIRKARGLEDGFDQPARRFGTHVLRVIETVIEAVYAARGGAPPEHDLRALHAPLLNELFDACRQLADSGHKPTRALARELLNGWDTFWVVLPGNDEVRVGRQSHFQVLRHLRIEMADETAGQFQRL